MSQISVELDDLSDVLYVKRCDQRIVTSREAPHDGFIILNFNADGETVGVQIMYPGDVLIELDDHPDAKLIPEDIRSELKKWCEAG